MLNRYQKIFSIQEIESQPILQWVFGATIFSYFVTFNGWIYKLSTSVASLKDGTHLCWPYFQACEQFVFLEALPYGYSQTTWYMVLFGLLITAVYYIYKNDWVSAHVAILPAFFWHVFVIFIMDASMQGNFDYYLFFFALILLFLPHKEFFLKLAVVIFYFLSTAAKIHPSWVAGSYFSTLKTGLPLFPDWSIPIWTNLVIFMEMIGAWFLMSRHILLQRSVLVFFIIFHLYSGILVGYHYPSIVLPTLLILFGPMYRYTEVPWDRKSIVGWILVGLLFVSHSIPHVIRGDEKLTLEGNYYGLYMFEANHQCVSSINVHYTDGSSYEDRRESISARYRCDPYRYWSSLKKLCDRSTIPVANIEWTFDHSVNGGPFLRIVDVPNVCVLDYKPFSHNEWIKTETDNPVIIGTPVRNVFY